MKRRLAAALLALALFPQSALAWGDAGHMTVAQIAYTSMHPKTAARVDELVKMLAVSKTVRYKNKNVPVNYTYTPVTLACWMDDLKGIPKFDYMKAWHYINRPQPPFPGGVVPKINVESRLVWAIDRLAKGKLSKVDEAQTVAYLFHLVGDVHQPMHAASRFTSKTKHDAGGNDFAVDHPRRQNLHSYWDAAGGLFNFDDFDRWHTGRLSAAEAKRISGHALAITQLHPKGATSGWDNLSVPEWVRESWQHAGESAYAGIVEGGEPSGVYEAEAQKLSRRRMALAGYRLAAVLDSVYAKP